MTDPTLRDLVEPIVRDVIAEQRTSVEPLMISQRNSEHAFGIPARLHLEYCRRPDFTPKVPLPFRVLYGFLAREGMRTSEAAALTWSALDLTNGAVVLDENKTDTPRSWALDPGVVRAPRRLARDDAQRTHRPRLHPFADAPR